jgi:insertion element IS1 protein InsB
LNHLRCPHCGLSHIKRNGYTHYGKQNYRCKNCDRQFVEDSQHIGEEMKDLVKVLLLERISLRGICRVTGVSLTWLLDFITEIYAALPDDLNVTLSQAEKSVIQLVQLEVEADEIWSFVASKENKQWVWIALDITTKQVIAFYVGDRSTPSARELWQRIPQVYRDHATFYTDGLAALLQRLWALLQRLCGDAKSLVSTSR